MVERAGNYSLREQITVPLALRRARVDLFHAPHYVVSPLTPCPTVVTIHDCIHLRFPQYLPNRAAHLYARVMMTMAARRAHRILTVSHASKEDILRYLKVPASKIEVIYNALDERLATPPTAEDVTRVRERFQLTSPFILYAGNIKPHKNVDRLIEAFAILRRRRRRPQAAHHRRRDLRSTRTSGAWCTASSCTSTCGFSGSSRTRRSPCSIGSRRVRVSVAL